VRSLELFAGAGGLAIGVSQAGFEHAAVLEWDRWACQTLADNESWPIHQGDVRDFDYSPFRGIDLVSGGPPCQPFSMGGKHNAHLDRRDMFPEAIRAIRELRPKAFVFENVKGLRRESFANYLAYIRLQLRHPELEHMRDDSWPGHLRRLERHETGRAFDGLHYTVIDELLNAADFGVPQKRERVFIVGFRSDIAAEWSFPKETHSHAALAFAQRSGGEYWDELRVPSSERAESTDWSRDRGASEKPWVTLREAISGLPDPEREPKAALRHRDHQFNPGARSYPGHTGSPLDQPAKTLKAGVHGVPGGENMLRRPDGSVRYFSVRESARLQTFPDEFVFHGSWSEAMRQLGNAVPVRLAELIARDVRRHLQAADDGFSSPTKAWQA
jgi:DNA (cytosine-5)-methyltransferase 1